MPITSVDFYIGAIEHSAEERRSKIPHSLPEGVSVIVIKPGQNLSAMLVDRELDVIFSATKPSSFNTCEYVTYLFPNFKEVEVDYY